ncbi:MAG TPA: alpha-1,4-glucan--maltose-1-phosphate maltosyltransferase [Patescibacteria group bacterium]|nr:alpha-1,4-glucan--maltose-1-phosphate maltosyltransferase [Patescibacteria group bacterium]
MGREAPAKTPSLPGTRPSRVVIAGVRPEVDSGRFPIKRVVGESVDVTADIFADGHEVLAARLLHRTEKGEHWNEVPMSELGNDRWEASFRVTSQGHHVYTIQAWIDEFQTWRRDLLKRVEAGQQTLADVLIGAELVAGAAARAAGSEAGELRECAKALREEAKSDLRAAVARALDERVAALAEKYADRSEAAFYGRNLVIVVDREKARFSAWYEMFPRSCACQPGRHGTFQDVIRRLPYVAGMGFDVLYLPPIHPIGRSHRKGVNNVTESSAEDVGSPWAIGSAEGGHKAIHPQLGTREEFHQLVQAARAQGLEIALDLAFQCSPDHPYVREHPEWFRIRPDGSVQYAENPPKKYEDIVPINFDTDDWRELWEELRSVVLFWIGQGVRIFRVDNPHTKPFAFWQWLIAEVKREYPDVLFLAEAFTRPKVMYELAKRGFTQSYTYFAWRNTGWDLTQYFTELTRSKVGEFFRPSLWPNTPDILTEQLQYGGRAAFQARLVLAATLGASYGIYGPAFELSENRALRPGSEEYLDSEKYQIRRWDIERPDSLREFIAKVNAIRRENPALQANDRLEFHPVDNDQLIAYSKTGEDGASAILVIVNLNPYQTHSGWVELETEALGLPENQSYQMHDLLTGARYLWQGRRNYVELNPSVLPAHIFRIRRRVRSERDFDYFL